MDAATLEVQTLDGRLLASLSGPASLQTLGGDQTWMNEPIQRQSEDCLFLNVWTPDVGPGCRYCSGCMAAASKRHGRPSTPIGCSWHRSCISPGARRAGQPTYVYEFAYPPAAPGRGSPQAFDLPFVFGSTGSEHVARKIGRGPGVDSISRAMMRSWDGFAAAGVAAGPAHWPAFDPVAPQTMHFGAPEIGAAALAAWPAYRA